MNVTRKYFNGSMTAKAMKKLYRDLALEWHPDVSSKPNATEEMKFINAEFAYWYARAATEEVKNEKSEAKPSSADYYSKTYDSFFAKDLESAINWLLNNGIYTRKDLEAEIIGVFIWISGEALKNEPDTRNALKASNFRFSRDKLAWFYTPTSTAGHVATGKPLEQIRAKYGSVNINARHTQIG